MMNLALALAGAGRLDEAIAKTRETLQLDPDSAGAHAQLADMLLTRNHPAEALQEAQHERDDANRMVASAEVYWAFRGDREGAFRWLNQAVTQHHPGVFSILVDAKLRLLDKDRRFGEVLDRMGLKKAAAEPLD